MQQTNGFVFKENKNVHRLLTYIADKGFALGERLPSERELAEQLGRQGIAVRAGLHCAPLAHRSAGTLERGTVRLSVSAFTRAWQVDQAVERIVALSR